MVRSTLLQLSISAGPSGKNLRFNIVRDLLPLTWLLNLQISDDSARYFMSFSFNIYSFIWSKSWLKWSKFHSVCRCVHVNVELQKCMKKWRPCLWNATFHKNIEKLFVGLSALVMNIAFFWECMCELQSGGKPSTWFPPGVLEQRSCTY